MENKFEICKKLLESLQLTRCLEDLEDLIYSKETYSDQEIVLALFKNGYSKVINVTYDSGIAMISDIIKALR